MKEKTKVTLKKNLIGFLIGIITGGSISVIAATYFQSNDVTYDNSVTGLKSENVQDAIDELYGVCFPPEPGTDTITDLVNTNPDELYKDEHGDIRYYGASPNNYVSFNNELWRIIGVIDGKIKIIRNESIGNYKWASNANNNWNNSDLKSYLNGDYYNSIDETYRKKISEETFYLGGPTLDNYQTLTASGYYNAERSSIVYGNNPTSTDQKIGLMYSSDYGYAAGSSCLTTALYKYNSGCKNSDWLFSKVNEWLQTPYHSNNVSSSIIDSSGSGTSNYTTSGSIIAVRPTLYLTTETQITGGNGSQSNPYTISL